MGNIFSQLFRRSSETNLETRIVNLEQLDRNHDQVVTKAEFTQWVTELEKRVRDQQHAHQAQLDRLQIERDELAITNKELATNLEQLAAENRQLVKRLSNFKVGEAKNRLGLASETTSAQFSLNLESKQILEQYVEELLQNPEINLKYFPDVVERRLYRNVFEILLGLVDKVVTNTSINFLGHSIQMNLQVPTEDSKFNARSLELADEATTETESLEETEELEKMEEPKSAETKIKSPVIKVKSSKSNKPKDETGIKVKVTSTKREKITLPKKRV